MSKVGDRIKDKNGIEWVVARIWKWPKYNDLDLINTETGEYGYLRQEKSNLTDMGQDK